MCTNGPIMQREFTGHSLMMCTWLVGECVLAREWQEVGPRHLLMSGLAGTERKNNKQSKHTKPRGDKRSPVYANEPSFPNDTVQVSFCFLRCYFDSDSVHA